MRKLFTSESVTEGHPDKMADQISDTILDAILEADPQARVAVESSLTTGQVHVFGEVRTKAKIDVPLLVRDLIREIGYTSSEFGFDSETCGINVAIGQQSPDIAMGVDSAEDNSQELGAGDQGLMFGYATDETRNFMPMPISMAHFLSSRLTELRKDGTLPFLLPDGKTQVTIAYEDNVPVAVDTVVVSTQHLASTTTETLREKILAELILPSLNYFHIQYGLDIGEVKIHINPTGRFVIGGPQGDAGLTGRKIIVDTYGGMARHGGGAFSGKDPSKVDRSAAYAARWIARSVVEAGLASRCEVQIAYAIGRAKPVSIYVDTFGTGDDERIQKAVEIVFDLRPQAIIKDLGLSTFTNYSRLASYGHMGRSFAPWEVSKSEELLAVY